MMTPITRMVRMAHMTPTLYLTRWIVSLAVVTLSLGGCGSDTVPATTSDAGV